MAIGWIKLHRKIQECDLWSSEDEPFDRRSAWVDLLFLPIMRTSGSYSRVSLSWSKRVRG